MLSAQIFNYFDQSFHTVVNLLGVSADYISVKKNNPDKTGITVGYSGRGDSTLVQSLDVETKTITVKAEDFSAVGPEKFDQFIIAGQKYVADSVQKVHLNGKIIGYRITTKGK